jgi:hypothetical protein
MCYATVSNTVNPEVQSSVLYFVVLVQFIPGAGAAKGRWLAAGLQLAGPMLMNTAKQMHQDIMTTPAAAALPASNASAATAAAVAAGGSTGNTSTAAAGSSSSSAASGTFSFASMRQAVAAAATATAAGARPAQAAGGSPQKQLPQPSLQQQQQACDADVFRSPEAAHQSDQERYQEEEQAAKVCLYCPGQLWHLRRCTGEDVMLY